MFISKDKRYTQEFKIEAVKQTNESGYSVSKESDRIGICTKTFYHLRGQLSGKLKSVKAQGDHLRLARLEAEFRRVQEKRIGLFY
jgi:transposase-like protein